MQVFGFLVCFVWARRRILKSTVCVVCATVGRPREALGRGGGVDGLNGFFWERRSWSDGNGHFWYMPLAGHVLLEAPPVVTGGLLADEV